MLTLLAASEAASTSSDEFVSFSVPAWVWVAFAVTVLGLLLADLLLVHRDAHVITTKEEAIESAVWISIGLAFGLVMLAWQGGDAAGEYYAGYLIEKSLSVDNIFVIVMLFTYFAVPAQYQHRVLFWGILGALLMRGAFIAAGLPLSLQVMAPHFAERALFRAAGFFERETEYWKRLPNLVEGV